MADESLPDDTSDNQKAARHKLITHKHGELPYMVASSKTKINTDNSPVTQQLCVQYRLHNKNEHPCIRGYSFF